MKFRVLIRLIVRYPFELLKWFIKGKFHPVWILIVVITLSYLFKIINYEPKIIAAIFIIIGLAIIIWQMIGDTKRFSEHNPNTFKNWIKKFPKLKPKVLNINVSNTVVATISAKAHIKVSLSENAKIEEKVEFILKELDKMGTRTNQLYDELDNKISEVNKKIKEVESKVEESKKVINSIISDVTVGNYDLRLLSIVLMICGTFIQILI